MEEGKKIYWYNLYGLNIESEIILPELESCRIDNSNNIDAKIILGQVPEYLKYKVFQGIKRYYEKDKMYMCIIKVAHFYVYDGNTIMIEPIEGSTEERIRGFLLGFAFGLLLRQRNTVATHSGSVNINGQSVILAGESGAGKSTLTTGLINKGYEFLGDEVAVMKFDCNNNPISIPSYPHQKLTQETMKNFKFEINETDEEKRCGVFVNGTFLQEPVPIGAFFEIVPDENIEYVEIKELFGKEKIESFFKHTYMKSVTTQIGINKEYFSKCMMILNKIPVYQIIRPKDQFTVEDQIEGILNVLNEDKVEVV